MIKMNGKMKKELEGVDRVERQLPSSLADIAAAGIIENGGCFLLSALASKSTNAAESDFLDRTGWECFVNSIHIDDFAESDYLFNAILFVRSVFGEWARRRYGGGFQSIISSDEFGSVVKFHFLRDGESWVGSDLEKYEESILLVDSAQDYKSKELLFDWFVCGEK
ncbi:hypothetical protein [Pseudomonas sp. URIL14HWK12:I7]|uniref:hypothetical protein n=1 Tax=Pseudomonas sp. URIL14HWK12:I7 TaxID=1283285 RepID=UPI0012DC5DAE|nr:hypothetical protein [Pseudomonas sp. URIL14HWK12:I7]